MRIPLLFLLILSLSFAKAACEDNAYEFVTKNIGSEIGLVLIITVLVIAITYMAGQLLSKAEYLIFSKDEAFHLGISVGLLVMISTIVYTSCIIAKDFLITGTEPLKLESPCYYAFLSNGNLNQFSLCYVSQVEKDAKDMVSIAYKKEIDTQMDSNWAFTNYFPLMGGVTTPTNAYKKTWSMQYSMINTMIITPALISITAQKLALQFASAYALTAILPLGLFFRILIPTRPLGNLLIALAVGLYILIPFSYSLHGVMYESVTPDCFLYNNLIDDTVFGDCDSKLNFWSLSKIIPQAYFLPNFTLALFITYLVAINKALRVIG